jgi:hypothetical protein
MSRPPVLFGIVFQFSSLSFYLIKWFKYSFVSIPAFKIKAIRNKGIETKNMKIESITSGIIISIITINTMIKISILK